MTNIKAETIARTVVLLLALVNQALTVFGFSPLPIADEEINDLITLAFTVGAAVWAWWKNNSFTKNAIEADKYLDELKQETY